MGLKPISSRAAKARLLEQQGQVDAAVEAYKASGAPAEAARLLMTQRRYDEAAELLVSGLGVHPAHAGNLSPDKKREALTAAICYSRANNVNAAVQLFVAIGEHPRAIELLERVGDQEGAARVRDYATNPALYQLSGQGPLPTSGGSSTSVRLQRARALEQNGNLGEALDVYVQLKQYGHAARVAQLLGMHDKAADLYIDAGMPFEAALCYRSGGNTGRCLDTLTRVPRDDARYGNAAIQAIDLASELGVLDFALEQFLTRFVTEGPRDETQFEALYKLAKLYVKHNHTETAKETFEKLHAINPAYADVARQLQLLKAESMNSPRVYERILREDMQFRETDRDAGVPAPVDKLPDLPDLPGLPPVPSANATAYQPGPPPGMPAYPQQTFHQPGMMPPQPMYGQPTMQPNLPTGRETAARTASTAGWQQQVQPQYPQPPQYAPPQPGMHYQVPQQQPPQGYTSHTPTEMMPPPQQMQPPAQQQYAQTPTHPAPVQAQTSQPQAVPQEGLSAFSAGATIANRYELEKKIGKGGMAVVFKAKDTELDIDIALKVFQQPIEDDEQLLHRFKQELVLSRQLTHKNIIRLYDIGIHGGHRYITMELLSGNELKAQLGRPIDVKRGIDYLIQACAGLQYAHDAGIVHRDVKPQNFFVTAQNVLKVMDFGIAKRQATQGMTVAGMIAGTPNYMSPEQINGFSTVTISTDIYALGCIGYEMFTGIVPFTHPELMPLLMMHLTKPPEPLRNRNPALPAEVEQVVLKLMEKDPANRYPSCNALAEDLARIRDAL